MSHPGDRAHTSCARLPLEGSCRSIQRWGRHALSILTQQVLFTGQRERRQWGHSERAATAAATATSPQLPPAAPAGQQTALRARGVLSAGVGGSAREPQPRAPLQAACLWVPFVRNEPYIVLRTHHPPKNQRTGTVCIAFHIFSPFLVTLQGVPCQQSFLQAGWKSLVALLLITVSCR